MIGLTLELLLKQCHHPLPGILIGGLVVLHPGIIVLSGARHGEAVHRAGIADEFVLHAGFVESITEGLDRLVGNELVIGPVANQDGGLDLLCLGRRGGRQGGMKRDDRFQVGARVSQLQRGRTAEAVADGRQLRLIALGLGLENV